MRKFKFLFIPIVLIIGLFTFISCLKSDDSVNRATGLLPATSVTVKQDSINPVNQATNVYVTFELKDKCQEFIGINNLGSTNNGIDLGVYAMQDFNIACGNGNIITKVYKYTPKNSGTNVIRVWNGKNADNTDKFTEISIEIPAAAN